MQYINYDEAIVQRYEVLLEGWTFDRFVNPSELSTSLPPLQKLLDALNDGSCKFVKLTREQRKDHEKDHRTKVASGEIEVRQRKKRKDAGKKRKWISSSSKENGGEDSSDGNDSTTETDDRRKRHRSPKSMPVIDTSDHESDNDH